MAQLIFVGRENELNVLNQLLVDTKKGLGKLVFVRGEPGAGKSSLIRKFLSFHKDTLIAAAECVDKEGTNPYSPIKLILAELIAADISATEDEKGKILSNLKMILSEAGPDWIAAIPVLGAVASAGVRTLQAARKISKKPLKAVDIGGENEIHKLFEDELRRLAEKRAVIVFWDDLQWTDPSTLNMLFALGRSLRAKPFPLLLIGSYRLHEFEAGKEDPRLKNKAHTFFNTLDELRNYKKPESHIEREDEWFVEIDVPAFKQTDIDDLINSEFPGSNFPTDFVSRLESITEGNPLFVTGVLRFLKQGGDIFPDENGVFQLKADVLKTIPETVEAVIERWLDFLNKELRKILDYASVNGDNFSFQVIEQLLKIEDHVLMRHLGELIKTYDLINEDRTEFLNDIFMDIYCFKHTLVQKYVYENLHSGERRLLHRKVAEVFRALFGDNMAELTELKALYNRHMQIGRGLIDGTTLQLTKGIVKDNIEIQILLEAAGAEVEAAEHCFDQYANRECIEKAEKALAFLGKLPGMPPDAEEIKFKALSWKSKGQGWLGHYIDAEQTAQELLDVAKKQNNKKNIAIALNRVGRENENLGENEKAIDYYQKAIAVAESLDDKENIAEMYNNLGWVLCNKCDYDIAIGYHQKALGISANLGDKKNMGLSYICIGSAIDGKRKYDEAIEYYDKSLAIREQINDRPGMASAYNNIGSSFISKGEHDNAIKYFEMALEIREQLNDRVGIALIYNNIGLALSLKDDYDEAIEYYDKSLAINESLDNKVGMAMSYNNIGFVLNSKGVYDEAIEYYDKSLAISKSLDNKVSLAQSYFGKGFVLNSKEDYKTAIACYEKSFSLCEFFKDQIFTDAVINDMTSSIDSMVDLLKSEKDYQGAAQYYEKLLSLYERLEEQEKSAVCYINFAQLMELKGDNDAAIEYYDKAIQLSEGWEEDKELDDRFNKIGDILEFNDHYQEAIEYYKKALAVYESLGDEKRIAKMKDKITEVDD